MGRALKEMLQTLAPRERRAVDKRAADLIARERSRGDLNKDMVLPPAGQTRR